MKDGPNCLDIWELRELSIVVMSDNIRRVVQLICVKLGNHQSISRRSLIKSSETIYKRVYNKSFCFKEDDYEPW